MPCHAGRRRRLLRCFLRERRPLHAPERNGASGEPPRRRFKGGYGVPTLIQSDGAPALAAARETVFPGVRHQLCKFHKLRNLLRRLRQSIRDPKLLKRGVRLAKHIFSNTWVSSRKYAAQTLQTLSGEEGSS